MAGLPCRGFDHRTDNDEGAHNGFIGLSESAVISPDVGTAEMIFRVSASCYRRLFATVLVALLNPILANEHIVVDNWMMEL